LLVFDSAIFCSLHSNKINKFYGTKSTLLYLSQNSKKLFLLSKSNAEFCILPNYILQVLLNKMTLETGLFHNSATIGALDELASRVVFAVVPLDMFLKLSFDDKMLVALFALEASDAVDEELVSVHVVPGQKFLPTQIALDYHRGMFTQLVAPQRFSTREKPFALDAFQSFPFLARRPVFLVDVAPEVDLHSKLYATFSTLVHLLAHFFMIGEEFFAGKGLRAERTKGCAKVANKFGAFFTAVGTSFSFFVLGFNVVPQTGAATDEYWTVRTLFVFGKMMVHKMFPQVFFFRGFVVAKSAAVFFRVFLLVVFSKLDLAFEKCETVSILALNSFLGMTPLDVACVVVSVQHGFLAVETNFRPSAFLLSLVRFFFVLLQISNAFHEVQAFDQVALDCDVWVDSANVAGSISNSAERFAAVDALTGLRFFANVIFLPVFFHLLF